MTRGDMYTTCHSGMPGLRLRVNGRETNLIRWRGDTVLVNVNSPGRSSARSWRGKDHTRCARVCEGAAAQSGTCGGVAMLTLVYSTLTVKAQCVVNESIRDKNGPPARDRLALTNGMRFGCLLASGVIWRLPSTHVTVSPYKTSPWGRSVLVRTDNAHFTGWHVWPALKAPPASQLTVYTMGASSTTSWTV